MPLPVVLLDSFNNLDQDLKVVVQVEQVETTVQVGIMLV